MLREEADYLVERDAEEEAESVNEREETSSEEEEEEEEEEELELGLSLRVKKKNKITSGNNKDKNKWGRILTAKDFPTARSRASPISSSSSSSPAYNRVPDPGSANPPSQIVVGWPPIRAFRINSFISSAKDNSASEIDEKNKKKNKKKKKKSAADQCIHSNKQQQQQQQEIKSTAAALRFVKVKMDGDPIGRKVDLSAHHSYDTLALALEIMFRKPTIELCSSAHSIKAAKWLDGSSEFALTYQDRDGDWMLLGDVPWGMFLDTVRRLRIMRTSDATGLAPRFQSSTAGLLRSNLPKNK